jgi:hypothetical protein
MKDIRRKAKQTMWCKFFRPVESTDPQPSRRAQFPTCSCRIKEKRKKQEEKISKKERTVDNLQIQIDEERVGREK